MSRIFMTHKVADYDGWKKLYDDDAERRAGAGFKEAGHYHSSDDRNSFLIVWDTDGSTEEARAAVDGMLSDPALGEVMKAAGVLEKPTYWIA